MGRRSPVWRRSRGRSPRWSWPESSRRSSSRRAPALPAAPLRGRPPRADLLDLPLPLLLEAPPVPLVVLLQLLQLLSPLGMIQHLDPVRSVQDLSLGQAGLVHAAHLGDPLLLIPRERRGAGGTGLAVALLQLLERYLVGALRPVVLPAAPFTL